MKLTKKQFANLVKEAAATKLKENLAENEKLGKSEMSRQLRQLALKVSSLPGTVTPEERSEIMSFFMNFLDYAASKNIKTGMIATRLQQLKKVMDAEDDQGKAKLGDIGQEPRRQSRPAKTKPTPKTTPGGGTMADRLGVPAP